MSDGDQGRAADDTVIEQALEVLVYAPLGFALEARSLLPRFVERGRNQVALARVVGKFAVRKGREDLEAWAVQGQGQVVDVLRLLGVAPPGSPDPSEAAAAAGDQAAAAGEAGEASEAASPEAAEPPAPAAGPSPAGEPGVPVEDLAIPDYDSLSASQVVPRLDSLSDHELEDVRRYEHAHRGRKTILGKISQLQHG